MLVKIKHSTPAGKILSFEVAQHDVETYFNDAKYAYESQRDHVKHSRKRRHTHGPLMGNSQQFSVAYCRENKRILGVDGYHRGHSLRAGTAWFLPGATVQLCVYVVETMADVKRLYDQFNSAVAAKKASCYFESGLNEAGIRSAITAGQIMRGPRNYAVQFAANVKGTLAVRDAVVRLKEGLLFINSLDLQHARHEIAGMLGAFLAIAQHSSDKSAVKDFIVNLNLNSYKAVGTKPSDLFLETFHAVVRSYIGKTGGTPNATLFQLTLAAFVRYQALRKGRRVMTAEALSLPQFMEAVKSA